MASLNAAAISGTSPAVAIAVFAMIAAAPISIASHACDGANNRLKDPIILREKGSGTKKEMDLFLERTGITTGNLNVIARMNDLESIKKSIVNGLGISILSSRSVNDLQRTKQILVFPLEEAAHKRSFYIVYSKNRILKPHVKQFVQFVRDYYM